MNGLAWWRDLAEATFGAWTRVRPALLKAPLRYEIMITVDTDGAPKVFYNKLDTPQDIAAVVNALIGAGVQLAQDHGIRIRLPESVQAKPAKP